MYFIRIIWRTRNVCHKEYSKTFKKSLRRGENSNVDIKSYFKDLDVDFTPNNNYDGAQDGSFTAEFPFPMPWTSIYLVHWEKELNMQKSPIPLGYYFEVLHISPRYALS